MNNRVGGAVFGNHDSNEILSHRIASADVIEGRIESCPAGHGAFAGIPVKNRSDAMAAAPCIQQKAAVNGHEARQDFPLTVQGKRRYADAHAGIGQSLTLAVNVIAFSEYENGAVFLMSRACDQIRDPRDLNR